jgi:hypothetical protein
MSRSTTLLLVLTGTLAGSALGSGVLILARPASARQTTPTETPAARDPAKVVAGAAGAKTATATVESVDREKRTVTLKSEQGKSKTVQVPEEVAAFDQIKKGDRIRVSYQESVALAVHRPGEAKPEEQVKETAEDIQGARPGRAIERKLTISGEVVSVDPKRNLLRVKGPQGKTQEIAVEDPALRERLKELKPGEVVEVIYTEAIAASLEPASK